MLIRKINVVLAALFVSTFAQACTGIPETSESLTCENPHVQIVGMEKEKALVLIKESGFRPRILREDGQSFIGAQDFRLDRINLFIEDGKVLGARCG
jgi:hypothetical protein